MFASLVGSVNRIHTFDPEEVRPVIANKIPEPDGTDLSYHFVVFCVRGNL
jgi:hypothetical protein